MTHEDDATREFVKALFAPDEDEARITLRLDAKRTPTEDDETRQFLRNLFNN